MLVQANCNLTCSQTFLQMQTYLQSLTAAVVIWPSKGATFITLWLFTHTHLLVLLQGSGGSRAEKVWTGLQQSAWTHTQIMLIWQKSHGEWHKDEYVTELWCVSLRAVRKCVHVLLCVWLLLHAPVVLAAEWTEWTCGMFPLDTQLRETLSPDILASENNYHHNGYYWWVLMSYLLYLGPVLWSRICDVTSG